DFGGELPGSSVSAAGARLTIVLVEVPSPLLRETARGGSSFAVYHSAPSQASTMGKSTGMMDGTECSRSARIEMLRFLLSVRIHGIANHTKATAWRAAQAPNAV